MELSALVERKGNLESSLKNIEQSFHVVTGHLAEVNYQIAALAQADSVKTDALPEIELDEEVVVE
jgi:hypothetical protein